MIDKGNPDFSCLQGEQVGQGIHGHEFPTEIKQEFLSPESPPVAGPSTTPAIGSTGELGGVISPCKPEPMQWEDCSGDMPNLLPYDLENVKLDPLGGNSGGPVKLESVSPDVVWQEYCREYGIEPVSMVSDGMLTGEPVGPEEVHEASNVALGAKGKLSVKSVETLREIGDLMSSYMEAASARDGVPVEKASLSSPEVGALWEAFAPVLAEDPLMSEVVKNYQPNPFGITCDCPLEGKSKSQLEKHLAERYAMRSGEHASDKPCPACSTPWMHFNWGFMVKHKDELCVIHSLFLMGHQLADDWYPKQTSDRPDTPTPEDLD